MLELNGCINRMFQKEKLEELKQLIRRVQQHEPEPPYQPPGAESIYASLMYQRQQQALQRQHAMMAPYQMMFAQMRG